MKPHKLLPLLPRPILSSSILKLIRLPSPLLFQIVPSIKPAAIVLLPLLLLLCGALSPRPVSHCRTRQCGGALSNYPHLFPLFPLPSAHSLLSLKSLLPFIPLSILFRLAPSSSSCSSLHLSTACLVFHLCLTSAGFSLWWTGWSSFFPPLPLSFSPSL